MIIARRLTEQSVNPGGIVRNHRNRLLACDDAEDAIVQFFSLGIVKTGLKLLPADKTIPTSLINN